MNALDLLDRMDEMVNNSPTVPFSGCVIIDNFEINRMISDIRNELNKELEKTAKPAHCFKFSFR